MSATWEGQGSRHEWAHVAQLLHFWPLPDGLVQSLENISDMVGKWTKEKWIVSESECWRKNWWDLGGCSQGKRSPCSPPLQFPQLLGTAHLSEVPGLVPDGCSRGYSLCPTSSTIPSPFPLAPSPVLPHAPSLPLRTVSPEPLTSHPQPSLLRPSHPAWFQTPGSSVK